MSFKNYRNSGIMVGQHFNTSSISAASIDARERDTAKCSVCLMLLPNSNEWIRVPESPCLEVAIEKYPEAWHFLGFDKFGRDFEFNGKAFNANVLESKEYSIFFERISKEGSVTVKSLNWLESKIAAMAVKKGILIKQSGRYVKKIS